MHRANLDDSARAAHLLLLLVHAAARATDKSSAGSGSAHFRFGAAHAIHLPPELLQLPQIQGPTAGFAGLPLEGYAGPPAKVPRKTTPDPTEDTTSTENDPVGGLTEDSP